MFVCGLPESGLKFLWAELWTWPTVGGACGSLLASRMRSPVSSRGDQELGERQSAGERHALIQKFWTLLLFHEKKSWRAVQQDG